MGVLTTVINLPHNCQSTCLDREKISLNQDLNGWQLVIGREIENTFNSSDSLSSMFVIVSKSTISTILPTS